MYEGHPHQRLNPRLRDHELPLGQEEDQVAVLGSLLEDAVVADVAAAAVVVVVGVVGGGAEAVCLGPRRKSV